MNDNNNDTHRIIVDIPSEQCKITSENENIDVVSGDKDTIDNEHVDTVNIVNEPKDNPNKDNNECNSNEFTSASLEIEKSMELRSSMKLVSFIISKLKTNKDNFVHNRSIYGDTESVMCDVIKIYLKWKDERRSRKGNP